MKAPKPLKRTALKRPTREAVIAWEQKPRTPIARTRLDRKRTGGKRPVRQIVSTVEEDFKAQVKARARGRCEACLTHRLSACDGRYAHAHHLVPRSRGRGWPGLHTLENGLGVSAAHHSWIHDHPAEASDLGLLLSRPFGV